MPVRPATWADIPAMTKIFAASFGPDPMFQLLVPHQDEHPKAFLRAARENFLIHWYDYRQVHMVSYEEVSGDAQDSHDERSALLPKSNAKGVRREIITGIAQWERVGKGWEHVNGIWGRWDPRLLIKPLISGYFTIRRRLFPNKSEPRPTASNPDPLTMWNFLPRIIPFCEDMFSAPHRQARWSLEVLAIHPDYQGRGFGRELVHDGFQKAKRDPEGDLPVCVVAAEGKDPFYQKCGFGDVEGYTSTAGGSENPLYQAGLRGGAVLWTK